jgi:hypothetical protein
VAALADCAWFQTVSPLIIWYVPSLRYTRGLGWRMHCGVEVTESSTNKQHHLRLSTAIWQQNDSGIPRGTTLINKTELSLSFSGSIEPIPPYTVAFARDTVTSHTTHALHCPYVPNLGGQISSTYKPSEPPQCSLALSFIQHLGTLLSPGMIIYMASNGI